LPSSRPQPPTSTAIVDVIDELGRHYAVPSGETRVESAANVASALFGVGAPGHALLAWDGDELAAMAAYAIHWPGRGTQRVLFLKELYVRENWRGQGIGQALMEDLFATAKRLGIDRVDWQADAGNVAAQRFYERLGATVRPKVTYRMEL
jgi:GNAT superfamily N-acetyltransferase